MMALTGCNLLKGPPGNHECRSTLRSIIALENAYFSERGRYSIHPVEIGFAPAQGNRCLYLFASEGELTRRDDLPSPPLSESVGYGPDTRKRGVLLEDLLLKLPSLVRATLGLEGPCPDCSLTVACVGAVEPNPEAEVWTISTKDRPGAPRGTPLHYRP